MRLAAHHNAVATVIRGLASERSPACLLDREGTFIFVNEAWERHAAANGGAPGCLGASLVGTRWLDHIAGDEMREVHASLLARAWRVRGPRPRLLQVGESNTPTTSALVSTRFEPVLQGGEPLALSIVHTVVRERPIGEVYEPVERPLADYVGEDGAVVQCACCRRVRDPAEPERWDLVPALLEQPPPARQALCELCRELHYPATGG